MAFRMQLLLCVLALMLIACSADNNSTDTDTPPEAESAPAAVSDTETQPEPAPEPEPESQATEAKPTPDAADDAGDTETAGEGDEYAEALAAFRASETVRPFFSDSYGYALFPKVGKGGFVVGGAYGNGRVYVDGQQTGTASLTQASIGLQAGGQAFSEIIFFEDASAYSDFISGNFEFDAEASAVLIKAGASAQTSTMGSSAGASKDASDAGTQATSGYRKGTATFAYARGGLMAGAAIGGQKFKFEPVD